VNQKSQENKVRVCAPLASFEFSLELLSLELFELTFLAVVVSIVSNGGAVGSRSVTRASSVTWGAVGSWGTIAWGRGAVAVRSTVAWGRSTITRSRSTVARSRSAIARSRSTVTRSGSTITRSRGSIAGLAGGRVTSRGWVALITDRIRT
jgi:hypothetical protein